MTTLGGDITITSTDLPAGAGFVWSAEDRILVLPEPVTLNGMFTAITQLQLEGMLYPPDAAPMQRVSA